MADDARISTALPSHPKTRKLRKRLGSEGCWALVCLFLWVADNRPDGALNGLSDEDIELAADWDGEAGAFVRVLAEVGFLDGMAGAHAVHDWKEHNPWAASRGQRVEAARKAARERWGRARAIRPECASHTEGIRTVSATDAESMQPPQKRNAHHLHHTTPTHEEKDFYAATTAALTLTSHEHVSEKSSDPLDLFVRIWNENRGSMPECRSLTKERATKLRARLKSNPNYKADFCEAVKRAASTPFLTGQNERGWVCTFDFLVKNDTVCLSILEGRYAGNGKLSGTRSQGGAFHDDGDARRYSQGADLVFDNQVQM